MINEPQISPQHGKWEIQSESSFTIVAQKEERRSRTNRAKEEATFK
jgi:hypothetical protein